MHGNILKDIITIYAKTLKLRLELNIVSLLPCVVFSEHDYIALVSC